MKPHNNVFLCISALYSSIMSPTLQGGGVPPFYFFSILQFLSTTLQSDISLCCCTKSTVHENVVRFSQTLFTSKNHHYFDQVFPVCTIIYNFHILIDLQAMQQDTPDTVRCILLDTIYKIVSDLLSWDSRAHFCVRWSTWLTRTKDDQ